jgi:hypothetical protein
MKSETSMQAVQKSPGEAKEPKAKTEIKPLRRGDAALFELSGNVWRVIINQDVTPEQLDGHPHFWNMLGDDVHEGDEIKGRWANGRHFAKYEVVNAGPGVVAARLCYAVEGMPIVTAMGSGFPVGFHVERSRPDENEGRGHVAVRDSDGKRYYASTGLPWKTEHDVRSEFPRHSMFRNQETTRYVP